MFLVEATSLSGRNSNSLRQNRQISLAKATNLSARKSKSFWQQQHFIKQ